MVSRAPIVSGLTIFLLDNGYRTYKLYDRPPIFNGKSYGYLKACMCIHINFVDKGIWDVIINGPKDKLHEKPWLYGM